MYSSTITARLEKQCEARLLGTTVGGLVFMDDNTGECTNDPDKVLEWISIGDKVNVIGYYTFEWTGDELHEVWHTNN